MEHTHHPYWRLHFDIDGQGQDQLLVRRGDKWAIHSTEAEDLKVTAAGSANWLVRRPDSRRGVWIVPGGGDGAPDRVANHDLSVRRYHDYQDDDWGVDFYYELCYADKEPADPQYEADWY